MKRWLRFALVVIIAVPAAAYVAGLFIAGDHEATVTVELAAAPERVWARISDFDSAPDWRPDVIGVTMEPTTGGPVRFVETSSNGTVRFEVVSQDPPRRQVVRIVDDDQPFGGTWTWVLEPVGSGTRVTLIEAGFVKSPILRTMGRLFLAPTETLTEYLRALAISLGETRTPQVVSVR